MSILRSSPNALAGGVLRCASRVRFAPPWKKRASASPAANAPSSIFGLISMSMRRGPRRKRCTNDSCLAQNHTRKRKHGMHHEGHEEHEARTIIFRTLCVLRITMLLDFLYSRKFLSGQSCEFFCACLARCQQCGHHVSTFFRDNVTMSLRHFGDQAVRPQQSQLPSHGGHLPALFGFVLARPVEMGTHVAVAKAVERKFPPVDDRHESGVVVCQRIKRPVALTVVPNRPTHYGGLFLKRGLHMDRSQSRQMARGGRPTHFGSPIKIGHAWAQDAPLFGTAGVALRRTKTAKIFGLVDRGFHTQHVAFVVELKRVLVHPVLDPNPLATAATVAHHFIVNPDPPRTPPKPKHLLGSKTHHGVMHQRGINPLKRCTIPKHHVGGVFGLGRRPVVLLPDGSVDLGRQRMASSNQRIQKLTPLALVLPIHQRLGTPKIANPRIAVLLSAVLHPGSVHLTPEPLSAVQTHLNQKRKPALKPQMQKAQILMHPIKIQVHALTPLKLKFELLRLSIPPQKPGVARLHTTQNRDQTPSDFVALLNLARDFLFACAARWQIDHGAALAYRQLLCRPAHTSGQVGGESLKVLPQHFALPKVFFHHRLIVHTAQRPLQPKTIPAVQHSDHLRLMLLYERTGYLIVCCRVGGTHAHHLYQTLRFCHFGCGFAALGPSW